MARPVTLASFENGGGLRDIYNYGNSILYSTYDYSNSRKDLYAVGDDGKSVSLVASFTGGSPIIEGISTYGKDIFISFYDNDGNSKESGKLYKSNGTVGGLALIGEYDYDGYPLNLQNFGKNIAFFNFDGGGNVALIDTDDYSVQSIYSGGAWDLENVGKDLYWTSRGSLYSYSADKRVVSTIADRSGGYVSRFSNSFHGATKDYYFFSRSTSNAEWEGSGSISPSYLWRTDGSVPGTLLVKDIEPTPLDYGENSAALGNILIFSADDRSSGSELWATDGTSENTKLIKDINPGSLGSGINTMVAGNSYVYFQAHNGGYFPSANHNGGDEVGFDIWRSDGTETGTIKIFDRPENWTSIYPTAVATHNDSLIFSGDVKDKTTGAIETEIWISDGSTSGTRKMLDLGKQSYGSQPLNLHVNKNTLYFTAADGTLPNGGRKLFRYDLGATNNSGNGEESSSATLSNISRVGINSIDLDLNSIIRGSSKKTDFVQGTDDSEILGFGAGSDVLTGKGAADIFLLDQTDKFGKKGADKIVDFNGAEGDILLISVNALKGLSSSPQFAIAADSTNLKSLASSEADIIYYLPKGELYFNENDEGRSFGKGGLFAILEGAPSILTENISIF